MALRRRLFWSCFCIDKFVSAGTSRTQCFSRGDAKPNPPSISESLVLRDPYSQYSVTNKRIVNDSLVDVSRYYMKIIELFGEVNAIMSRAKTDSTAAVTWPPVAEYSTLDANLQIWKESLPETFQFTPSNLEHHKDNAGKSYLNIWLSMHAVWSSSLMVLHRGSLAYGDVRREDVSDKVYGAIQLSIETCKECVRTATGVFKAMRDYCEHNILPFMGYSAYIFSTLLMTSTFSKGPDACQKSHAALETLHDLIVVSIFLIWLFSCTCYSNSEYLLCRACNRIGRYARGWPMQQRIFWQHTIACTNHYRPAMQVIHWQRRKIPAITTQCYPLQHQPWQHLPPTIPSCRQATLTIANLHQIWLINSNPSNLLHRS